MAYSKKTWKARQGLGLNKFSIDGATPVSIVNQPDTVTQQGDALSAGNLNDLETRIDNAFTDVENGKADKTTTDDLQNQIINIDADIDNIEALIGGEAQTENVDDTPISVTSRLIHHANMLPNGSFGIIGAKSVVSNGAIVDFPPTSFLVRGINLWDEEWEANGINATTGLPDDTRTNRIRSKNFILIDPSATYYFYISLTTDASWIYFYDAEKNYLSRQSLYYGTITNVPSNCLYFKFESNDDYGSTYLNDIQIANDSLPTTLKTTYHAHDFHTVDTSFMTGKKGINSTVYDYVENVEDGGILRRKEHTVVGSYTFTGEETVTYNSTYGFIAFAGLTASIKPTTSSSGVANVLLAGFNADSVTHTENASYDLIVAVNMSGVVRIKDTSWTDGDDALSDLTGKTLYYEKTTESVTYDSPIPSIPISDYCTIDPNVPTDVPFSVKSVSANTLIAQINENKQNIQTNSTNIGILQKEVANLKAKAGDEIAVTYPSATYGMDEVPPSVAPYSKVSNLIGVGRVHNNQLQNGDFSSTTGWEVRNSTFSVSGNVATVSATGADPQLLYDSIPYIVGHMYLYSIQIKTSRATSFAFGDGRTSLGQTNVSANTWTTVSAVLSSAHAQSSQFRLYFDMNHEMQSGDTIQVKEGLLTDVTQYFNGTIPSNADTITEIQQNYPELLVPSDYDSGTVVFTTYDKVEAIGLNWCDSVWEGGLINTSGVDEGESDAFRTKNYLPILPLKDYYLNLSITGFLYLRFYDKDKNIISYTGGLNPISRTFQTPVNASYVRFYCYAGSSGWGSNVPTTKAMLSLGTTSQTWVEYKHTTLTLPSAVTLKGVGSVHEVYDLESGEISQPIGSYTFTGNEEAVLVSNVLRLSVINSMVKRPATGSDMPNVVMAKYIPQKWSVASDMSVYIQPSNSSEFPQLLCIRDTSYATADAFKASLVGQTINFELATPDSPATVTPMPDNFIEVEGDGTIKPNQTQSIEIDTSMTAEYLII